MIPSYGKINTVGHYLTKDLFNGVVEIQEKIDGSQFSFGRFNGEIKCRSRKSELYIPPTQKMFSEACEAVVDLDLMDGWVYRGEYLQKPKHNTICYDRYPNKHIIIFDIEAPSGASRINLDRNKREKECARLGFEAIPVLDTCVINTVSQLLQYMDTMSVLGGSKIEGIVVKNYFRYGEDEKILRGKFVSEAFRETHRENWKKKNPSGKDIRVDIGQSLNTSARWQKSIIHMAESGTLTNSPRDIGPLLHAIHADILEECKDEIKEELFKWARKDILREACRGFPQWYKEQLMKELFNA